MEILIRASEPAAASSAGNHDAARFTSILDLLLTVGYIDGLFHDREADFIRRYVDSLLLMIEQTSSVADHERAQLRAAWRAHFDELWSRLEAEIATLAQEVTPVGDGTFVPTRLRLRALLVFRTLSTQDQVTALELVQALIHADGVISPSERELYAELVAHFTQTPVPVPAVAPVAPAPAASGSWVAPLIITPPVWKELVSLSHPLLDPLEQTYSPHPNERKAQIEWDYNLVQQAMNTWYRQRTAGADRLAGITDIAQIADGARFLDGFVYVARPTQPMELVVLGDLHGCYSCLKAALLQSNFIERAWAHQWDPQRYPDVKLVFLGDYIDRGRFSFDGVLRAALQLFVAMPDQVILLRGNHEWLTWFDNRIVSGVYPAEALASIVPHVPIEMLEAYRLLFEHMPTSFLCDRTMFVHGGIPREDTFAERFRGLSSINDPEMRFQMMWSDPGQIDHVPVDLQRQNPRFTFGRDQFRAFMERAGLRTMIRGHEVIEHGFDVFYDLGEQLLLTLFSAGGHGNADLPIESAYRAVTPMALTVQYGHGAPTATPWPIQYQSFNYAPHNGLYRPQPVLEFRYG
ncbi:MAG: metallophosphoesterase family protein [Proteobacteria bacterium]|nr:metallophosphoesterase family protein [Pseudomonadota bacterium]